MNDKFNKLREDLFKEIKKRFEQGDGGKSYEGSFSFHYPSVFGDDYSLELGCYIVGPSRHYTWSGNNFEQCIDKADTEIRSWFNEP